MSDRIRRDRDGTARLRVRFYAEECDDIERAATDLGYDYVVDFIHDAVEEKITRALGPETLPSAEMHR